MEIPLMGGTGAQVRDSGAFLLVPLATVAIAMGDSMG
jgi:hypothetical protein